MSSNNNTALVPDYTYILGIEANFDAKGSQEWVARNFQLPFLYGLVYLVAIYTIQAFMKNKSPLEMKTLLVLWNIAMALFSALGAVRVVPELVYGLKNFGFRHSVCDFSFYDDCKVTAFWTYVFVMSKSVELFDTLFIVFRKRKIIFLHWFHHCSVLVFTWITLKDRVAMGRWYMNMNYMIHACMYTYYAISALKIKVPTPISLIITISQILQMFVGFFVSLQGFVFWYTGEPCNVTVTTAVIALVLYGAYGVLFLNFFIKRYLSRNKKDSKKVE